MIFDLLIPLVILEGSKAGTTPQPWQVNPGKAPAMGMMSSQAAFPGVPHTQHPKNPWKFPLSNTHVQGGQHHGSTAQPTPQHAMSSTPPRIHAKDRKFQKFPRKPDMLLQENLKKSRQRTACNQGSKSLHGWKIAVYFISHLQQRAAERGVAGRGCGCSGSQLGTSRHRVGNTLAIKLCLALSHLHGPCSCQAGLSARMSLYSQQALNEPAHSVFNYTVLCMFVIPESQKTQQRQKELA